MKIILDSNLSTIPNDKIRVTSDYDFLSKYNDNPSDKDAKNVRVITGHSLTGNICHNNYLGYLATAYNNHYGIVFSPDIAWNMILCELAIVFKNAPEEYRYLFSDSDKTQEISVMDDGTGILPMEAIIAELQNKIPTNTRVFLPEFSTSTKQSKLAQQITFADAVSPYFNYSMYLCGLPSVTVTGNHDDWKKLRSLVVDLAVLLTKHEVPSNYLIKVESIIEKVAGSFSDLSSLGFLEAAKIEASCASWWRSIFSLEKCGSGHQVEVEGWISEFFINQPNPRYILNYSEHISLVNYKIVPAGGKFRMYSGLFSSKLSEDNVLVPDFSYIQCQIKNPSDD